MKIKFPWEQHLINVINKDFPKRHSDHDIYHSFRVINLARKLQETYGGDDEVLTASAYLHDLGNDIDRINHVTHSLVIAQHLLPKTSFPEQKIFHVLDCIRHHETFDEIQFIPNKKPKLSIDIYLLQDADRLDATGAIGISRTFVFGGHNSIPIWIPDEEAESIYSPNVISKSSINHLKEKIIKLEKFLNTPLAKRIAKERVQFVELFLSKFFKEWYGIDTNSN